MKAAAWALAAAAAGIYICGSLVDADLWWHVTVGRWILNHRTLPTSDLWNYYGSGQPWRAYSWSSEVFYAWLDQAFGVSGLLVAKVALGAALAGVLCFTFSRIAADWAFGWFLGAAVCIACYAHFVLRPQTFTWILFSFAILAGESVRRNGLRLKSLLIILVVFVAWANTHLSAIVGICFLAVWVGRYREQNFDLRPVVGVVLTAFLGTLLTPYLGGEWATLLGKVSHPLTHRNIIEFRSATFADYPAAFLILFLIVLLRLVHERPRALELPPLAAGCLLAYGGLAVIKFLPFSYIALGALIARLWRTEREVFAGQSGPGLGDALNRFSRMLERVPAPAVAALALLAVAERAVELYHEPVRPGAYPVEAVNFLQETGLEEGVANVFGDGGYLIYRFSNPDGTPRHKVMVDGRTNVNPPQVVEAYQKALYGRRGWQDYVDLGSGVVLWRSKWPLSAILDEHPDWCRIYFEGGLASGWSIFLRSDKAAGRKELQPVSCSLQTEEGE